MIQRAKGVRLGYLPQNATLDSDSTVWQECLGLFSDLIGMQERLNQLEHAMGGEQSEEGLEAALGTYGRLQAEFERLGGYTFETRIRQTLTGLGFSAGRLRRAPCTSFQAGSARAPCWPNCCSATRICCCWMSLPTTWISPRSSGWSRTCASGTAQCC